MSQQRSLSGNSSSKRPAPFSLRLTEQERAYLIDRANGAPLSSFIKSRLFDDQPLRARRVGSIIEDREAFARALALLGKSDLAQNVASLARAAEVGALAVDPDTEALLLTACNEVRHIRTMMVTALGLFAEGHYDS